MNKQIGILGRTEREGVEVGVLDIKDVMNLALKEPEGVTKNKY